MALFQLHFFPQNLLTTHNIFFLKKYKHVHPSWSHNIVAKFVLNTKTNTCWSLVCYNVKYKNIFFIFYIKQQFYKTRLPPNLQENQRQSSEQVLCQILG